ncbi:MAG TPA: sortase [Candidatus Saccharimonadales bacterium]|nr:sortase [Candidatus Saccharimonadales bacterium]
MKKNLAWKLYFTGGALIIAALIVGSSSIRWPFTFSASPVTVSITNNSTPNNHEQPTIAGKPVRVIVPARNIALPVIDGYYNEKTGDWTLTNDKAQFATITSLANNKAGSTLIYGHDTDRVFKRLEQLQPGDEAQVVTSDGHVFVYQFRSSVDVKPSDISVLSYSGPAVLTLQTCSGAWSQNRKLMTFDFVEVQAS